MPSSSVRCVASAQFTGASSVYVEVLPNWITARSAPASVVVNVAMPTIGTPVAGVTVGEIVQVTVVNPDRSVSPGPIGVPPPVPAAPEVPAVPVAVVPAAPPRPAAPPALPPRPPAPPPLPPRPPAVPATPAPLAPAAPVIPALPVVPALPAGWLLPPAPVPL